MPSAPPPVPRPAIIKRADRAVVIKADNVVVVVGVAPRAAAGGDDNFFLS